MKEHIGKILQYAVLALFTLRTEATFSRTPSAPLRAGLAATAASLPIVDNPIPRHVEVPPASPSSPAPDAPAVIMHDTEPSLAPLTAPAPAGDTQSEDVHAIPVRVRIPAIDVDAPVLPVGVTPEGKMGIPHNTTHAGWYERGALPGEEGVAVLDGHLNFDGRPGVFSRLHLLAVDDVIRTEDAYGNVLSFRVQDSARYHVADAPVRRIVHGTGEPGAYLHLITCAGTWRTELGHYDERLVIFAERIDHSAGT